MKRRDFLKAMGIGAAALAAPNIVKAKSDVKILGGVENWRIVPGSDDIPEVIEVEDDILIQIRKEAERLAFEDYVRLTSHQSLDRPSIPMHRFDIYTKDSTYHTVTISINNPQSREAAYNALRRSLEDSGNTVDDLVMLEPLFKPLKFKYVPTGLNKP